MVTDPHGKILDAFRTPEKKTNNEMEYKAAAMALFLANQGDEIITDSQLIHGQLTQGWKCNFDHLRSTRDLCLKLITDKRVTLKWVPREESVAGKVFE